VGDLLSYLIAFDLDGTLIDSRRDLADSANQLIVERGGFPLTEEAVGAMVGDGAALLVHRALTAAGIEPRDGDLARFLGLYDARLLNHTRPYDGMPTAVRVAHGYARLGVITNKPLRAAERILEGLNLLEFFDEIIGGDGPFPRKPDPSGLVAMMERSDSSRSRTLLVGDSAVDLETARRAQVKCCLVSFGFGFQTVKRESLTSDEHIVENASSLVETIVRFARA
jgi:phosphoglycolate phosphatase